MQLSEVNCILVLGTFTRESDWQVMCAAAAILRHAAPGCRIVTYDRIRENWRKNYRCGTFIQHDNVIVVGEVNERLKGIVDSIHLDGGNLVGLCVDVHSTYFQEYVDAGIDIARIPFRLEYGIVVRDFERYVASQFGGFADAHTVELWKAATAYNYGRETSYFLELVKSALATEKRNTRERAATIIRDIAKSPQPGAEVQGWMNEDAVIRRNHDWIIGMARKATPATPFVVAIDGCDMDDMVIDLERLLAHFENEGFKVVMFRGDKGRGESFDSYQGVVSAPSLDAMLGDLAVSSNGNSVCIPIERRNAALERIKSRL